MNSKKMMTTAMTVIMLASTILSITAQPQRAAIPAKPANLRVADRPRLLSRETKSPVTSE